MIRIQTGGIVSNENTKAFCQKSKAFNEIQEHEREIKLQRRGRE